MTNRTITNTFLCDVKSVIGCPFVSERYLVVTFIFNKVRKLCKYRTLVTCDYSS